MPRSLKDVGVILSIIALVFVVGYGIFYLVSRSQFGARAFGGTNTMTLPKGRKFVNVTWKNTDLWVITRKAKEGEAPEEYEFNESGTLGILNGTVVIKEQ